MSNMVHSNPEILLKFRSYDMVKNERIDSLPAGLLHVKEEFKQPWHLVKLLLVMAYGQADVERGFSIYSNMMHYILKENSAVVLRIIYGHIQKFGGGLKCKIDKYLRNSARNASSTYKIKQRKQRDMEK